MKHFIFASILLSQLAAAQEQEAPTLRTEKPTATLLASENLRDPNTATKHAAAARIAEEAQSLKARGGTEGNGGDAVYQDGELVLRDLAASGTLQIIADNKEFLESFPGLIDLLEKIGAQSPELMIAIWNDLLNSAIWLSPRQLPLLPTAYTTTISRRGDVQVAVRKDRDIFIHRASLEAMTTPPEYLFVHEALHGLLNTTDAWGHEKVRAVVRYFHDNRDKLTRTGIQNVMSRAGNIANYRYFNDFSGFGLDAAVRLMQEGASEDSCHILNSSRLVSSFVSKISLSDFDRWKNLSTCPRGNPDDALRALYPQLRNPPRFSISFNPMISRYREQRKESLAQCRRLADPALYKQLENHLQQTTQYVTTYEQLLNEYPQDSSTRALWIRLVLQNDRTFLQELNEARDYVRSGHQSKRQELDAAVAKCAEAFGPRYMTRN